MKLISFLRNLFSVNDQESPPVSKEMGIHSSIPVKIQEPAVQKSDFAGDLYEAPDIFHTFLLASYSSLTAVLEANKSFHTDLETTLLLKSLRAVKTVSITMCATETLAVSGTEGESICPAQRWVPSCWQASRWSEDIGRILRVKSLYQHLMESSLVCIIPERLEESCCLWRNGAENWPVLESSLLFCPEVYPHPELTQIYCKESEISEVSCAPWGILFYVLYLLRALPVSGTAGYSEAQIYRQAYTVSCRRAADNLILEERMRQILLMLLLYRCLQPSFASVPEKLPPGMPAGCFGQDDREDLDLVWDAVPASWPEILSPDHWLSLWPNIRFMWKRLEAGQGMEWTAISLTPLPSSLYMQRGLRRFLLVYWMVRKLAEGPVAGLQQALTERCRLQKTAAEKAVWLLKNCEISPDLVFQYLKAQIPEWQSLESSGYAVLKPAPVPKTLTDLLEGMIQKGIWRQETAKGLICIVPHKQEQACTVGCICSYALDLYPEWCLPADMQKKLHEKQYHVYTGLEADLRRLGYTDTRYETPVFLPHDIYLFSAAAWKRNMSLDAYACFLTGKHFGLPPVWMGTGDDSPSRIKTIAQKEQPVILPTHPARFCLRTRSFPIYTMLRQILLVQKMALLAAKQNIYCQLENRGGRLVVQGIDLQQVYACWSEYECSLGQLCQLLGLHLDSMERLFASGQLKSGLDVFGDPFDARLMKKLLKMAESYVRIRLYSAGAVWIVRHKQKESFGILQVDQGRFSFWPETALPAYLREALAFRGYQRLGDEDLCILRQGTRGIFLETAVFQPFDTARFLQAAAEAGMPPEQYASFLGADRCALAGNIQESCMLPFVLKSDGCSFLTPEEWDKNPDLALLGRCMKMDARKMLYKMQSWYYSQHAQQIHQQFHEVKQTLYDFLQPLAGSDGWVYIEPDSAANTWIQKCLFLNPDLDRKSLLESMGFYESAEPYLPEKCIEPDLIPVKCALDANISLAEKMFLESPLLGLASWDLNLLEDSWKGWSLKWYLTLYKPVYYGLDPTHLRIRRGLAVKVVLFTREWDSRKDSQFWVYICRRLDEKKEVKNITLDTQNKIKDLFYRALEAEHKPVFKDESRRSIKGTALVHALAPKRYWFSFFDLLFASCSTISIEEQNNEEIFRKKVNDLFWQVRQIVFKAGSQGADQEKVEIEIKSTRYFIPLGLKMLMKSRPGYSLFLFHSLMERIKAFNQEKPLPAQDYLQTMFQEWFSGKIQTIDSSHIKPRKISAARDTVSRQIRKETFEKCRISYIFFDDNLGLSIPRIDTERKHGDPYLYIYYGDQCVKQVSLDFSFYAETVWIEAEKVALPAFTGGEGFQVRLEFWDQETKTLLFDTEQMLYRHFLLLKGGKEAQYYDEKSQENILVLRKEVKLKSRKVKITRISTRPSNCVLYSLEHCEPGVSLEFNGKKYTLLPEQGKKQEIVIIPSAAPVKGMRFVKDDAVSMDILQSQTSLEMVFKGVGEITGKYLIVLDGIQIETRNAMQNEDGEYRLSLGTFQTESIRMVSVKVWNNTKDRLIKEFNYAVFKTMQFQFNRPFYYTAQEYEEAYLQIEMPDGALYQVEFTPQEDTVLISMETLLPEYPGYLECKIPKIQIENLKDIIKTDGEGHPYIWIEKLEREAMIEIQQPDTVDVQFYLEEQPLFGRREERRCIGNEIFARKDDWYRENKRPMLRMRIETPGEKAVWYDLARVFYREGFMQDPVFKLVKNKLFWDKGHGYVGSSQFLVLELYQNNAIAFKTTLSEKTDFITLPEDIGPGIYPYAVLGKNNKRFGMKKNEKICQGELVIGSPDEHRFKAKNLVLESVKNLYEDQTDYIPLNGWYIENIEYAGTMTMNGTDGARPAYWGTLYQQKSDRAQKERAAGKKIHGYAADFTTPNSRYPVNPVIITYIDENTIAVNTCEEEAIYCEMNGQQKGGKRTASVSDQEKAFETGFAADYFRFKTKEGNFDD